MTVASTTSKVTYSGNGTTTSFTVPFYFLGDTHLSVLVRSALGVETTKVLNTDYTVFGVGNPAGGSIIMTVAPASGETLAILRNVPQTQETDYQTNDPFPAQAHEQALDKLTMEVQQLNEAVTRAVKVQATDTGNTADTIVATLVADAAQTQSLYNSFVGTYYGAYATAPAVDPLGNPLTYGDLYYNTTLQAMQVYTSTGWQATAQSTPTSYTSQLFSGTGAQTAFTLSAAPASLVATEVFISGVRQRPTTDYTVSGTTLTFVAAPASGTNNIFVRWTAAIAVGTPNDGSVTTAKIQDKAVSYAKLQDISTTQRVLGRNTAGAGVTEEVTLSQLLDWIGSAARGDILYRGASAWARLAAGTAGRKLQTGGAGADPAWADGITTHASGTVSTASGAVIDFASIPAWAKRITIAFKDVNLSGTDDILIQLGTGGSPQATGYSSTCISTNSASGTSGTSNTTGLVVFRNTTSYVISGVATLINCGSNLWVYSFTGKPGTSNVLTGGGNVVLSGVLDIVRLKTTGTNTFSGTGSVTLMYE